MIRDPSARVTTTSAPDRISRSRAKAAGPLLELRFPSADHAAGMRGQLPMTRDPAVHDNDESVEKAGMRNAWGNVAGAYDEMFAARMAHLTGRGLDLLAPEPHWDGLDVACGPGLTTAAL